jgi:hypothetical protein
MEKWEKVDEGTTLFYVSGQQSLCDWLAISRPAISLPTFIVGMNSTLSVGLPPGAMPGGFVYPQARLADHPGHSLFSLLLSAQNVISPDARSFLLEGLMVIASLSQALVTLVPPASWILLAITPQAVLREVTSKVRGESSSSTILFPSPGLPVIWVLRFPRIGVARHTGDIALSNCYKRGSSLGSPKNGSQRALRTLPALSAGSITGTSL